MKNILLIDYYGACSENGRAIGHSPKAIKEYGNLLNEEYSISAVVSPCIANEINKEDYKYIYSLRYNIIEADYNKISKRILDKYKILYNIHQVFQLKNEKFFLFYRVDLFFMIYLLFHKKNRIKKIALVYQLGFGQGILEKLTTEIYAKALKKLDGVIYTQRNMKISGMNSFYMPDFLYIEDRYKKFRAMKKQEKVICVGAMNPYKKLEELVRIFNKLEYPLEIVGYFFDKNRYSDLRRIAGKNIAIVDMILDEEEYYEKLAQAKYSILPYDMKQYTNRTSGVLIESAFLDVIPIAPDNLLKNNEIYGIGYEELEELEENIWKDNKKYYVEQNREIIKKYYDQRKVKKEFITWINDILQE